MNKNYLLVFILLFSYFIECFAAAPSTADIIGIKGFLEEVLAKRYSQTLSTIVDKSTFTVGAQLELVDIPPKKTDEKPKEKPSEIPFDLQVGNLDSDQLLKQFATVEEKSAIVTLLSTKKIKSVTLSVGLREDLGTETKDKVASWIADRAKKEFGGIAKTEVSFVKEIAIVKSPDKKYEWWDWLQQFQTLAAVLLMALTFIFGILLWRMTTAKTLNSTTQTGEGQQVKLSGELANGTGKSAGNSDESSIAVKNQADEKALTESISILNAKINAVAIKLKPEMESLLLAWLNSGEEGKTRLAFFAETVSKEFGRLPIPPDVVQELAAIFNKMAVTTNDYRKELLEKVYWDLMTAFNLGVEALSQPFSYLANVESDAVNKILMSQNSKLQTIVSNYLPDDVRKNFIKGLNFEEKKEVLETAAKMSEISKLELTTMEASIKGQLGTGENKNTVELSSMFEKIIGTLSPIEEIKLLSIMPAELVLKYKRKTPSIAFLQEWPVEKFSLLLQKLRTDQIVAYLRVVPEMKEKVIANASPMTAEVVADDFSLEDKMTDPEKEVLLQQISSAISELIEQKEVSLDDLFPLTTNFEAGSDPVVNVKSA